MRLIHLFTYSLWYLAWLWAWFLGNVRNEIEKVERIGRHGLSFCWFKMGPRCAYAICVRVCCMNVFINWVCFFRHYFSEGWAFFILPQPVLYPHLIHTLPVIFHCYATFVSVSESEAESEREREREGERPTANSFQ